MKHLLLITLLSLITIPTFAQLIENHDWDKTPRYKVEDKEYSDYSAVILLDHRIKEFAGGRYNEPISMKNLTHKAIKILDKKSIEEYNRVYIPSYGTLDEIKARTIKPDGTIVEVNKDNIKEIEDERYGGYTIFALEGVDVGDIVEYMYKRDLKGDYCGIEIFQQDVPVLEAVLEIKRSRAYDIETKSYSGLSDFVVHDGEKHVISITENIPAIADEDASNDYLMRAAYRIENFIDPQNRTYDVITWQRVSKDIADYGEVVTIKGYNKLFKELGLTVRTPVEEKVIKLEKYFKENFTYKQGRSASSDKFKNILKNKYGNEIDMTRAMKYLLRQLNVRTTWMVSTDKDYIKIDPDFPNTTGLREHILYIPVTEKYLSMGYTAMRYGAPPSSVIGNKGLVVDGIGVLKDIEYDIENYSNQQIKANITFDKDFTKATIDKTNSYTGFRAIGIRSALNSGSEDYIKSITHDYMTDFMGEAEVTTTSTKNESFDLAHKNEPVTVNSIIETSDLIEDAEDFYIFSFGKIIGRQSELYNEKERVTPVEIGYPLEYNTEIEITVPEGYTVSGLEDCTIKNECKDKDSVVAGFESFATQEGNKVTIKLHEYYKSTFYKTDQYEDYRAVINSAADFNKLALIFEKE